VTYAVIFTAEVAELDEEYSRTAGHLRELALSKYGCLEFNSCAEDGREIAVSYWDSEEQIRAWKQNPEHLAAQQAGRARWYRSYRVQVVEITREYGEA
jgi:heme-degrading monooxygenase HmoA